MPHDNALTTDLAYLRDVVRQRLEQHFRPNGSTTAASPTFSPPVIRGGDSPYARFVQQQVLLPEERIALLVALAPHVHPNFFEPLIGEFLKEGGEFPEFGGVRATNQRSIIPTGDTVLFILAGNDIDRRLEWQQQLFNSGQFFSREKILAVEEVKPGEPIMSGRLVLDSDYVELFTFGKATLPRLSSSFPAQYLSTEQEWDDLVLSEQTLAQIRELEIWVRHNDKLMYDWGMQRKLKPGYRALFYGPPGTGKTFTATLLGKYTEKDVFRVDLSMVISKYIGETETNLANLFDKAQNKNWILFFDEADALFSKRTNIRDAHDKYANQEVSYLLQRIESYPGLTILASNFKDNIDAAFVRRFNAIIYFPMPSARERLLIWQKGFPDTVTFAGDVNFPALAQQYELSGANIMNVVQYACLAALAQETTVIDSAMIRRGILRELTKEGKIS